MGFSLVAASRGFVNLSTVSLTGGSFIAEASYIVFVYTTASGIPPSDNPTISSGPLVLTKVDTIVLGNGRMIAWKFTCAANVTQDIVFTYPQSQLVQMYTILTDSPATYLTTNSNSASGTSADPSIEVAAIQDSHIVAMFVNNTNPFGGTPESGWTEDQDDGLGGPIGLYIVHRNNTSDNTVTVTRTSSTWLGIAVQFTGRRVFNL